MPDDDMLPRGQMPSAKDVIWVPCVVNGRLFVFDPRVIVSAHISASPKLVGPPENIIS